MPDVHIDSTTVTAPGPYWHDEFDVVHVVREINPNYTMCHKWVRVLVLHNMQIEGYIDATPNCLLCMVIER